MNNLKTLLIFILIASAGVVYSQRSIRELKILHWNDFHARNLPYKATKKQDGETITYLVGGSASMLGYLNFNRDEKSLVVNAGDDYQGTPISSLTRGFSQIKLLNKYNLDAFTLGNHEFDYGLNSLDSALKYSEFKYLAGNLFNIPEDKYFADLYTIKEINGIKIGIIGITTDELRILTVPKNVEDLYIFNNDSAISRGIEILKNEKCDLIMLLSHCGVEFDSAYASKFYGDVDIIIGGHSHTVLRKPKIVNNVIIGQAGSYGKYLGKIDLKVDIDKDTVIWYEGKLIETVFDSTVFDKEMMMLVEKMEEEIAPELNRVIGKLENDWKAKGANSNLGQWESDVFRKKTNSDVAFINSGGIRKSLFKGDIKVRDIWEINPFGNTINLIKVDGKLLKLMLHNHFIEAQKEIEKSGYADFLLVSGLKIVYDHEKLKSKEDDFFIELKVNGEEINDTRIYQIATNNYVASQINKFFGQLPEKLTAEETNIIDRDAFIEAVEEEKIIQGLSEERIIELEKK